MTTQEQRAEWRELADVLGKYAEPPDDARYEARDAITALLAERDALAAELAKWRQKYMSSSESWPDTIPYDESEPGGWPKSIPVVEPFQD